MLVQNNVQLQPLNTFHIVARAQTLVRLADEADVQAVLADPELARLAQAQFEFYAGLLPQPGSCLASTGGAADAQAVARGR